MVPSHQPGINILISTLNEGIERVKSVLLERRDDVTYIVVHQYTDSKFNYLPRDLEREDVTVVHLSGKGVTKSRNHAIELADADIGLFSDDDVTYRPSDIDTLKKTFVENPEVDVAVFKIRTPPGDPPYKSYSTQKETYKKAPSVGTIEIAFRIAKVRSYGIWFDERFGAGQELLIGSDEKIFVHDCIESGLNVTYFPYDIVQHPYESTIKTIPLYDKRRNSLAGGIDARFNGWIAIPKAFLGTIKFLPDIIRHGKNPLYYLIDRLRSAIFILRTRPNEREMVDLTNKEVKSVNDLGIG